MANMTLKLLVDKKTNKVLFAEAKKDFVDFLIFLLSLPLASIIRALSKEKMAGSLAELYESVNKLDKRYIRSSDYMTEVLRPRSTFSFTDPTYPQIVSNSNVRGCYTCPLKGSCSRRTSTTVRGTECSSCNNSMLQWLPLEHDDNIEVVTVKAPRKEGFVEGAGTYMVMDDLAVEPLSTVSCVMVLKNFNVDNFSSVNELVVNVGMEEGLELLRASLQSKTVLSDVFLAKSTHVIGGVRIKSEH
ncbi:hypothetical protein Scep_016240 [Stephania cephalantha]|uniref:Uncharacterized protein n=1 Tax=Stephania cephalantha TaxID=152367 RepID=A0AAP0NSF2_9MAGN